MSRFAPILIALLLGAAAAPPALAGVGEPIHHDVEITLDPDTGRVRAVDRVSGPWRGPVGFRLAAGLEPQRVLVDGRAVSSEGEAGRWRLRPAGARGHEIAIHYGGTIAPPAGRTRARAGPAIGAEGAYLPAESAWLPLFDGGPVTYRVGVAVAEPYRAVVVGRLLSEEVSNGRYRAVFASERPGAPPALFAGPYVVQERRHEGIRLRTYFHAEAASLSAQYLELSARYLTRYQERIGPYPFAGFSVISAPLPVGLGFPGLTYIARRILRLPFIKARSLPHEIVHNWWGNGVTPDYGRGNWAEGLTTYMADYALVAQEDEEAAREMRLAWLRDYAALPPARDRPLSAFQARDHDADQVVGYNKAAFVFHMLSQELGRADFGEGLRLVWRRHRFGSASWQDLRRSFEDASGRDLRPFFAQWLERKGAPRLRLADVALRAHGEAHRLDVTVAQERPVYRLSVPIVVETGEGAERRRIALVGETGRAEFRTRARPRAVTVDPDYDLFRHLAPGEAPPILRDVTLNPDSVTLIAADSDAAAATARALAQRMTDTPVRAVAAGERLPPGPPVLLIGTTKRVESLLAAAGLGPAPQPVAGQGSARVWALRHGGRSIVAVAADSAPALEALLRPLPHYKGMSYLAFEGARAVAKGVWPPGDSPLRRAIE